MNNQHNYRVSVAWTGNQGSGTSGYRAYDRSHAVRADGKPDILASSDPAFRGDKARYNPEELLVASLSSCHMLWYLHLCAEAGVIVLSYSDEATGTLQETADGGGAFAEVTLHPVVVVSSPSMMALAHDLHRKAHERCFIANSVNFPVHHEPTCRAEE